SRPPQPRVPWPWVARATDASNGCGRAATTPTGRTVAWPSDPKQGIHRYDPIALSSESTVVAEYVTETNKAEGYQSEVELERELIGVLKGQAYEHLVIHHEAELVANLRHQLELLNQITFSDSEW